MRPGWWQPAHLPWAVALVTAGAFSPGIAAAEEAEPDARPDKYYSIRGTVYSSRLKRADSDGFDARLRLRLSASVYRYQSLADITDTDIRHLESIGLRPRIDFVLPTSRPHVTFNPSVELSVVRQRELGKTLVSGAVAAGFVYEKRDEPPSLKASATLKYGTRYDADGLNIDDYLKFTVRSSSRRHLGWRVGDSQATVTPFAAASYFLDGLDLGSREGLGDEIDEEYEVGLVFGTNPRLKLWKIKIPELEVSFTYGDRIKGLKIRF